MSKADLDNQLHIIRSFFFPAEALRRRERKNLGDTGYLVLSEAPLGFRVIWSRLSKMERSGILDNVSVYLMFCGVKRNKIWVEQMRNS